MRLIWALILCATASVASADTASKARVDAIYSAAIDRMFTQTDEWFEDGEFPRVIQSLKIQQQLYPNDYDIATNLGWMQENVEEWDGALATYVKFERDNPKDPDALLPQITFYSLKKNYPKVISIAEGKLSDKAHPNNFRMLARAYYEQKMYKDSLRVWDRYISLHPDDGQAKTNRAKVSKKLGL